MDQAPRPDLAVFAATSGHSGVDKVLGNLLPAFSAKGLTVELLRIAGHGPYLAQLPSEIATIDLGASHVLTSLPSLIAYLRKRRPRVILSDKDRVNRAVLLARKIAAVPSRVGVRIGTTVSVNLQRRSRLARWTQYTSIRRLYPWADTIIVPSAGAADDLSAVGRLPRPSIKAIPNPVVDDELFRRAAGHPQHPWFEAGEPPVVLGVGELSARKDFSTLLRAFAIVRRKRRCRLVVLGEGRQRVLLDALARELGIGADFAMPGFEPDPLPYMAGAAVFALTSTCEGSAIVLIEAMAAGTPVVATDCPSGPREALAGGRFGELAPVGDSEAVAAALERTLANPPAPEQFRPALAAFTVESSAEQYLHALGLSV